MCCQMNIYLQRDTMQKITELIEHCACSMYLHSLTLSACAARVTIVNLSVGLSVTALTATNFVCKAMVRYHRVLHDVLQIYNVWISLKTLRSKVMALFVSHIY